MVSAYINKDAAANCTIPAASVQTRIRTYEYDSAEGAAVVDNGSDCESLVLVQLVGGLARNAVMAAVRYSCDIVALNGRMSSRAGRDGFRCSRRELR